MTWRKRYMSRVSCFVVVVGSIQKGQGCYAMYLIGFGWVCVLNLYKNSVNNFALLLTVFILKCRGKKESKKDDAEESCLCWEWGYVVRLHELKRDLQNTIKKKHKNKKSKKIKFCSIKITPKKYRLNSTYYSSSKNLVFSTTKKG